MRVTLYTRRGCHLCEEAKSAILGAHGRVPFDYEELDIDADPELRKLYDIEVPVIAIDGKKAFKHRLTEDELVRKIRGRS